MFCRKLLIQQGCRFFLGDLNALKLSRGFHTSLVTCGTGSPSQSFIIKKHSEYYSDAWTRDLEAWTDQNNMLYPPSNQDEPMRPAEIYHGRAYVRHSPKKMWRASQIILNMNVDEAIAHLQFLHYKAAQIMAEVLLEAQEMAVKDHNVEFKSNLHVVSSNALPSGCRKIIKYHGRGMAHMNQSRFCHYYVMLREGQPPVPRFLTAYVAAVEHLNSLRMRTIKDGL